MAVQRISPQEARQKVQQRKALLVCAYDSDEKFSQLHLEGALSLSMFRGRLPEIPKDREIIFYCAWPDEATSASVAEQYRQEGFEKVEALRGGVNAWKESGYPMVK